MKTLVLQGLDCPHCTEKIAEEVKKIPSVKDSELNFMTKKLKFTQLSDSAVSDIKKIVKSIEPDVKVLEEDEEAEESATLFDLIKLIVALVLFAASFIPVLPNAVSITLIVLAYLAAGYDVLINCVRNVIKLRPFDECFLMTVATIGAFVLGETTEAAAVMIFYQIGELFQSYAVERSRKSITSLLALRPDEVSVKRGNEIVKTSPDSIIVGDVILVKAGERIPIDCKTRENVELDMSALTGESVPVSVAAGEEVLSGSINLSKTIELEVVRPFSDSAIAKILDMVENASAKKAKTERFITKFAKVYTPIVVFAAIALAFIPFIISGFSLDVFKDWGYRALFLLVVSCPCALVVSVPLGFFAGIGGASRKGILIKGANNIEIMSNISQIAFDKTGTLTKGSFAVSELLPNDCSNDELLELCALAECNSNHPIAKSIVAEYEKKFGKIEQGRVTSSEEISGRGIKAIADGNTVLAGNKRLLEENNIKADFTSLSGTSVYIACNGLYLGAVVLEDEIKPGSAPLMTSLDNMGIKTIMLTGDKKAAALSVSQSLGVSDCRYELLPEDKVKCVEELLSEGKTAFVGDGINDAPVLARADIGISMGAMGADLAIETADMVIMNDDIGKIKTLISICKKTMRIVRANIVFAIAVKILVLLLGALGIANMWAAVFADVGVALLCVLNALRALRVREQGN
ncbi:MAG: cadmium-translocating P-type ATPase [Ruminococcus sp.]|nr:cadmium-translocating P-type ATPase [Ruminococcus sp.]